MLVRDLGLNDLRKGGGWRELLRPYYPKDYRGLINEWLDSRPIAHKNSEDRDTTESCRK
jgi:hypothetical protein